MNQRTKAPAPTRVRCAIYTRKSTEEGLQQEFNSLDAQREAAEAYIASQQHEGWVCLPDKYDADESWQARSSIAPDQRLSFVHGPIVSGQVLGRTATSVRRRPTVLHGQ